MRAAKRRCPQCKNQRVFPSNRKLCSGCRTFNNRVRGGEILPPTYSDVTVEGYKEPLEPVVGGFGYIGAITRTVDGTRIQCHTCGYFFANLGSHILTKHGEPLNEYRYRHGLRIKYSLLSPVEQEKAQKRYNDNARFKQGSLSNLVKARAAFEKKRQEGWSPGGDQWSPQLRNERGMCREQTLAKIRQIAEVNDGVAVFEEFVKTFGEGQKSVVEHWFGTWDAAVKAAGADTYLGRQNKNYRKRRRDTIQRIRDFYAMHGRTPLSSDFNSDNDLPRQNWVSKNFGSLNAARRAAGVPELVHVIGNRWEEVAEFTNTLPTVVRGGGSLMVVNISEGILCHA